MTWHEDLSRLDGWGAEASSLVAVGWLERGKTYNKGEVAPLVYSRLVEMRKNPWQPAFSAGAHPCTLCVYAPEQSGSANLFIPGKGVLYVSPELIVHFMNAHGYAPPPAFCEAVLECPPMRTMKYLKSILANGGAGLVGHGALEGDESEEP